MSEEEQRQRAAAIQRAANTPLSLFRAGDPGKHVQTLLPTPEWKALVKEAGKRGVSLSLMLRVAARHHIAWLTALDREEHERATRPR